MFTKCKGLNPFLAHSELFLALVFLLGFLTSTLLGTHTAGRELPPPELLPQDINNAAQPIEPTAELSTACEVWQVLKGHDAGRLEKAVSNWKRIVFPDENQVWRHVARGGAFLYTEQLEAAETELSLAVKLDEQNAIAHYLLGLLRLEQAAHADEYPDALHDLRLHLVSYPPGEFLSSIVTSKTKGRYTLEAINELELAVKYASLIDLDQPLVPACIVVVVPYPSVDPEIPPSVGDLVHALGADNFLGKTHGLLAHLFLDQKLPECAEHHVDEAEKNGITVRYGYRLVGELYETQGRDKDAARAFEKAMKSGDLLAGPQETASQRMKEAFEALF